jgi:two-component system phosphate regulon sensor histidine kinase PhoR
MIGVVCVAALHIYRGWRVLSWLATDSVAPERAPRLAGLWGEVVDRCVRLIKRQAQQMQQSDGRLADFLAAIQASPNGVLLLDAQGRIEWINLTAASLLQLDPQRDVGQYVRNLVRAPAFNRYWNEGDFSNEVQFESSSSPSAAPLHLSVQLHPYANAKRLLLVRDITGLQRAEAMRRDFVANVSHEIRTPLTVLRGYIETLQTLPLDENEQAHTLDVMAQQAKRMQMLVNDLLMLSRLESSPELGAGQWISMPALSERVILEAQGLSHAIKHPPQCIVDDSTARFEIAGDGSELTSALSNLLSNAVRYSPAGTNIHLAWSDTPQGQAQWSVTNTGPGISAEHISRLTERFYRVDASRSQETGGTGLGLSIVKHVMLRHGGSLQIRSAPGQGATFSLLFPKARVRRI